MILHNAVIFFYIVISIQFFVAFLKIRNKKGKVALMALTFIFVLCGITRAMLDTGIFRNLDEILHVILLIACFIFVVTNQSRKIVESLKNDRYKH